MAIYKTKGVTPEWWTPASQADEEEPVQLFVQPLTNPQLNQVMPEVDYDRDWPVGPNAVALCLRWGLKDWQGVYEDDKPLRFRPRDAADVLPAALQQEIATRIISLSLVSEDDRKNS